MRNPDLTDNDTLKDLKVPVSLYFTYVDAHRLDYYLKNKQKLVYLDNSNRDVLVEYLKRNKYNTVSDQDSSAAYPGTIVVSNTGVQTPFMEPQIARSFATDLLKIIEESKIAMPLSYALGIRIEQLSPPVLKAQEDEPRFPFTRHPDGEMLKYLQYRFGKDFIERCNKYAWENGEDVTPRLKQEHNVADMSEPIYSGRQLVLERYASHPRNDLEARNIIFGTLSFANAWRYAKEHGFVHKFSKAEEQKYFDDYGVELGEVVTLETLKQIETIVIPDRNEYLGVELNLKTRSFELPLGEELWMGYAEAFRAASLPKEAKLGERRINILRDAKMNGGRAVTYMPVGFDIPKEELEKYKNREPAELEDVLLSPITPIREEYQKYKQCMTEKDRNRLQAGIDNMRDTVRAIRAEDNKNTSLQQPTHHTAKFNSNTGRE
jgi:hypothetical protein